jgi:hypothetical protein
MDEQQPPSVERRPYSEPQLSEYGDLEALTEELGRPDAS